MCFILISLHEMVVLSGLEKGTCKSPIMILFFSASPYSSCLKMSFKS